MHNTINLGGTMVTKLCDRAVRVALGIPRVTAARLAGVAKNTLMLYELDPSGVVGPKTRAACAALFADLRELLERLERRRRARLEEDGG